MEAVRKSLLAGVILALGVCSGLQPLVLFLLFYIDLPLYPAVVEKSYSNIVSLWYNIRQEFKILFWNITGVLLVCWIMRPGGESLEIAGPVEVVALSVIAGIFVGIFQSYKEKPWIALLGFFILSYSGCLLGCVEICKIQEWSLDLLWYIPTCIIGNFIGMIIGKR